MGSRPLPLDLPNPALRRPLHIRGLDRTLREAGVSLFDAQLRRVGLAPNAVDPRLKQAVVDKLGGHPVAIALAADASYVEGTDALLKSIKEKKGSLFVFIDKLVASLDLSDESRKVLQLLCLARAPIPRQTLLGSVPFPATSVLSNLIALSVVEVTSDNSIEVAGILREYFDPAELPRELVSAFHSNAALAFTNLASDRTNVAAAVEAEYHSMVSGKPVRISTNLIDAALARAEQLYNAQLYEEAEPIIEALLRGHRSLDVLRIAAKVALRRSRIDLALQYAGEVFTRDPRDTTLLSDLVRIALTQSQSDRVIRQLVKIAKSALVEDESILIIEGRMHLREGNLFEAEKVFRRAKQLTERNSWPYFYLGRIYVQWGDLDKAVEILTEGESFFYKTGHRNRNALNAIQTQLALAYILDNRIDLAGPIVETLLEEDPSSPEVIRAFAALTIKREGIDEAHKALEELRKARIRNSSDLCQFHLLYGLFYLGIDEPVQASAEFEKAHQADRSNVFVMMKWARTLYNLGLNRWFDADDSHRFYLAECARLVRKILDFDPDNKEAVSLMSGLHNRFQIDV